jgi:hypothetical protein
VQVRSFRPPHVSERDTGDHIVYSWHVEAARQDLVFGYEFACVLREAGAGDDDSTSQNDLAGYGAIELPPAYRERATALLERIAPDPDAGPRASARAIYRWILDHYTYREALWPSVQVFDTGAGPCTHAVKLFVELCRLAGVRARRQCGALLQRGALDGAMQHVEVVERGYSPFVHTWAEFHDPAVGWTPVEFLGWMLGSRSVSERNVLDASFRAHVTKHTELYDRYFFGRLDPFRLRTGAGANTLRTYPVLKRHASWDDLYRALFETRHYLSCTIAALEPDARPATNPGRVTPDGAAPHRAESTPVTGVFGRARRGAVRRQDQPRPRPPKWLAR